MTRSKVKLELIANESARKVTFRKRMKGLLKKMDELTTLCGVDACAILYSPYNETQPTVWPNPDGVHRVLRRFRELPLEVQSRKMLDQKTFLEDRVNKVVQQLEKLRKENRESEMNILMSHCLNGRVGFDELLDMDVAQDLCEFIDEKVMTISEILEKMRIKKEDFTDSDYAGDSE